MKPEIDNQVELCSLNSEDDPIEMVIEVEEIKQNDYFEALLIACGLSIAAFFGVFIRAGIQYYKIWRTETNYVSFCLNTQTIIFVDSNVRTIDWLRYFGVYVGAQANIIR